MIGQELGPVERSQGNLNYFFISWLPWQPGLRPPPKSIRWESDDVITSLLPGYLVPLSQLRKRNFDVTRYYQIPRYR